MSWLRVDDGFPEHPKVLELSDRAFRLHVTGLCYCARNLTDGVLVIKAVKAVCAITLAGRKQIVELRDLELWLPLDDGWRIKDYLDYNPDAESAKAVKQARSEAGRRGADKRWHGNGHSNGNGNGHSKPHMPQPSPGPTQKEDQELNRPVGEQALGDSQMHFIEALAAAEALVGEIRIDHCDSGTRSVVLAYAQELSDDDFNSVRRELVRLRGQIRNDGKWVNGALKKRAMDRSAA